MISISGGLIVTRASSDERLGADFASRSSATRSRCCWRAACWCVLALFPGCPSIPFLLLGGGAGQRRLAACGRTARPRRSRQRRPSPAAAKENLEALLKVEPLAIEMGLGLVEVWWRAGRNRRCCKRIAGIRRQIGHRPGLPAAAGARDRQPGAARARIRRSRSRASKSRATNCRRAANWRSRRAKRSRRRRGDADARAGLRHDGAGGFRRSRRNARAQAGYTVVDPVSVLGTHLAELIRRHAHELFSRQDAKKLLDRVARGQSQGGGRPGAQAAAAGRGAAGAAEPAARARLHPRRGDHPGSAGRSGRDHAQSGAAHRVRAPGASAARW